MSCESALEFRAVLLRASLHLCTTLLFTGAMKENNGDGAVLQQL